ncbi:hypothetical protein [Roseiconus nitratireducens]|uniref:hypothetical protein n=1 Tax=Roseiconus nitratireducens TaxID=2605748 RepID=UPI001375D623|nr:hypothetical protein [Roseiconus nitratireducens]
MFIINAIKSRLHRDVVANPIAHGWVLNLYLHGERYPETVCDYFQSEFAPTRDLADSIDRHASDEAKHVRLYTHALTTIGQPIVPIAPPFVFNDVVRSFTPGTFHVLPDDPDEVRRFKLANFMAHAHFLEKRVGHSIEYHAEACGAGGRGAAEKCVFAVMRDEARHVDYTLEAVRDLVTRRRATAILETHRRAEAKANLHFSRRLLRTFRHRFDDGIRPHQILLNRICQLFLDGADRFA